MSSRAIAPDTLTPDQANSPTKPTVPTRSASSDAPLRALDPNEIREMELNLILVGGVRVALGRALKRWEDAFSSRGG
ncbi:hypothetical protein HGRIS_004261 [Hohenbuehelia grisea]|uniref:Uncharacterized protein n=1 Tax=Hohenbuehelia grisea TaxID=104357 RepID=A0ABR3IP91_9AGAR